MDILESAHLSSAYFCLQQATSSSFYIAGALDATIKHFPNQTKSRPREPLFFATFLLGVKIFDSTTRAHTHTRGEETSFCIRITLDPARSRVFFSYSFRSSFLLF